MTDENKHLNTVSKPVANTLLTKRMDYFEGIWDCVFRKFIILKKENSGWVLGWPHNDQLYNQAHSRTSYFESMFCASDLIK